MPLQHSPDTTGQQTHDTQRLTEREARAVVALWGRQQEMADTPTLADVAEALDITEEQAKRLLARVRTRRRGLRVSPGQLRHWACMGGAVVGALVLLVAALCQTVGGFVDFGHHIYRPIPVSHWGFGPAYSPIGDVHVQKYGFVSAQYYYNPKEGNYFSLSYLLGGDPFP